MSISSKGSANHQNKKEFSSYLCDPPPLNLTLVRPESFHICSFFCFPGKKFPACCRKLVALPIKRDHLGHEWGWVATEIAFHENFATKMNSSISTNKALSKIDIEQSCLEQSPWLLRPLSASNLLHNSRAPNFSPTSVQCQRNSKEVKRK